MGGGGGGGSSRTVEGWRAGGVKQFWRISQLPVVEEPWSARLIWGWEGRGLAIEMQRCR